jgi:uncharacterized protein (DUF1697 family)
MARHVAFLRGMNLGGRRIKNDELQARFEELGLEDVATFRASGNVVFEADADKESPLASRIEAGLAKSLGYAVPVFLRSEKAVVAIAEHEPFDAAAVEASSGKLQVALLPDTLKVSSRTKVLAMATDEDRLAIEGRELFWLPSGGMLDSELDLKAIEAVVGPWTMRTMGTIEQIAAKHLSQ